METLKSGQLVIFKFRGASHEGIFMGNSFGGGCRVKPIDPGYRAKITSEFKRNYLILYPNKIKSKSKGLKEDNPNITFKLNNLEINQRQKFKYKQR